MASLYRAPCREVRRSVLRVGRTPICDRSRWAVLSIARRPGESKPCSEPRVVSCRGSACPRATNRAPFKAAVVRGILNSGTCRGTVRGPRRRVQRSSGTPFHVVRQVRRGSSWLKAQGAKGTDASTKSSSSSRIILPPRRTCAGELQNARAEPGSRVRDPRSINDGAGEIGGDAAVDRVVERGRAPAYSA